MKWWYFAAVGIVSQTLLANPEIKIAEEWRKLREELRKHGYPVAARVETPCEIAADMERVRREMERRAGKPFVSDMQRIGGGGGRPVMKPSATRSRLQPAKGLRK